MKAGKSLLSKESNWNFGGDVPDHFVDHIRASVPFYDEGHELICQLSTFFCQKDSQCYEIGTSTGELIKHLALYNKHKPSINWVGLDTEPAMIKKAREHTSDIDNISIMEEDARLFDFQPSDFIVSYYTIQFIPPRYRQELFNKLYQSLNWGGALLVFEKVRAPDARFQDIMTQLYMEMKKRNGFSADEIYNKSESLKSVMEPFSTQGNIDLMKRAGFVDITTVFKHVCFEGFLAIK